MDSTIIDLMAYKTKQGSSGNTLSMKPLPIESRELPHLISPELAQEIQTLIQRLRDYNPIK